MALRLRELTKEEHTTFDNDCYLRWICWQGIAARKLYLSVTHTLQAHEILQGMLLAHAGKMIEHRHFW